MPQESHATGILAKLIEREKTGRGGAVSQSQAEAILVAMSEYFLRESLSPGAIQLGASVGEYAAPFGVFPCKGHDEWCTVGVHDDRQWDALCKIIGVYDLLPGDRYKTTADRWTRRDELNSVLASWTCQKSPDEVMRCLQEEDIPAAKMQRADEVLKDPHLSSRDFFRTLNQPQLNQPLVTENAPVGQSSMPDPDIRPAPSQFEHTREIARELLSLSEAEIAELISSGVLEVEDRTPK